MNNYYFKFLLLNRVFYMNKFNFLNDSAFSAYMFLNYGLTESELSHLTLSVLRAYYLDYTYSIILTFTDEV